MQQGLCMCEETGFIQNCSRFENIACMKGAAKNYS
jgi:hypothetical protein